MQGSSRLAAGQFKAVLLRNENLVVADRDRRRLEGDLELTDHSNESRPFEMGVATRAVRHLARQRNTCHRFHPGWRVRKSRQLSFISPPLAGVRAATPVLLPGHAGRNAAGPLREVNRATIPRTALAPRR